MRNTPYVELMRRFLKPGEVLCNCSKSFHDSHLPACNHGCSAAQIMSGEELAARVLVAVDKKSRSECTGTLKTQADGSLRCDECGLSVASIASRLREARGLSGRPASADFDLPAPNDNIDGAGHGE